MEPKWFRRRQYRHFDTAPSREFLADVTVPERVAKHSFAPLIRFIKKSKRYKPKQEKTEWKLREIMFASHRDAAVLSYYSWQLSRSLEEAYAAGGLSENVVAYRRLGRGNYNFSAEALRFALDNAPCAILAFDVTDFFGSLDHRRLKSRLKAILGVEELPADWYQVYKFVTKFHYVDRPSLKAHPTIGPRFVGPPSTPLATIKEVRALGIPILQSEKAAKGERCGIPQGTPISATLSNLYLLEFDRSMLALASERGAFYRRYSDDILVICRPEDQAFFEAKVRQLIAAEALTIKDEKTERTLFDPGSPSSVAKPAQYLGFALYPQGPGIRPSSLSRRWRKMRKVVKRLRIAKEEALAEGRTLKVSTKALRQRFSPTGSRNFSSYARRSAAAFSDGGVIRSQTRRLEREFDRELRALVPKPVPSPKK